MSSLRSEGKLLAVIPARGGSKGVRDKNLQHVGGRSLIGRTIHTALSSNLVLDVLVSTESIRIQEEARLHGAATLLRPLELASDTASSESVLVQALELRPETEVLVFLQCTSPFLTTDELESVAAPVVAGEADVAFSAAPFHGFLWTVDEGGVAVGVNHDPSIRLRRQDRRPELLETGAAYVMRADGFLSAKHRFFGRTVAVEVDPRRSIEIDTLEDLAQARHLAPLLDKEEARLRLQIPRLIVLDFDGVFTDNRVHVHQDGAESVTCHRGDGEGLRRLQAHVPIVVLSTETNPVVSARCRKLGLPYRQGLGQNKLDALKALVKETNTDLSDVFYVGNDTNDLACMQAVGTAIAVGDAVPEIRRVAHVMLSRRGGDGALRELANAILDPLDRS